MPVLGPKTKGAEVSSIGFFLVTVVLFIKGMVVIFVSLRQLSRLKSDVAGPITSRGVWKR